MYPVRVELAGGKVRYYIRYRADDGKLHYLSKDEYDDFSTKKQCQEWINKNRDNYKHIRGNAHIVAEIKAKKRFPEVQEMYKKFEKVQKRDAPNSWESSLYYLDRFVIPFFIGRKGIRKPERWKGYFAEFRDFLEDEAESRTSGKIISYSTKNHCIRTLNKFLSVLLQYNYFEDEQPKCKPFPKKMLNHRGLSAVFRSDDYENLKNKLEYGRDFFIALYHTGMRFNEMYSLPFCDIKEAEYLPEHLKEKFKKLDKKVYGYIALRNQLDGKIKKRDKNTGFIKRKPLKSCIDESFKNRRIIPIFDEECWDILAAHHDIALEQWESRQFISKRQHDYFLFDMEVNRLRREFSKACKDLNLKDKCYHSARHTRVTLWTLEFDESTVRSFTGHKSDAYENYCHLGAMLMEEESQASLKIKPRKLSKRKLKKVG